MMKYLLLLIALLSFSTASSQQVSIDLSIKWISDTLKYGGLTFNNIPYLILTYRNNTHGNLYFTKITNRKVDEMPPIDHEIPLLSKGSAVENQILNRISQQKKETGIKETTNYVNIILYPYGRSCWTIDTSIVKRKSLNNRISDLIFDTYSVLANLANKDVYTHYDEFPQLENNFKIKETKNSLDNLFVFLKAGTSYSEKFNLIGFKIVTGDFEFHIKNNILSNFFYTGEPSWVSNLNKYEQNQKIFPESISGYWLYCGEFQTNSVRIKF